MPIEPVGQLIRPIEAPDLVTNALRIRSAIQEQKLYPMREEALRKENEARDLENKARQRTLNAASAIADAFKTNTTYKPDGTFEVNQAGVLKDLNDKGYGPESMKVAADLRAGATAFYNQQKAAHDLAASRAARMGQLSTGVLMAVQGAGEDDEQKKNAYSIAMPQAVNSALSEGLLNKEQADALLKHPYSPEAVQQIKGWAQGALNLEQGMRTLNGQMEEVRKQHLFEQTSAANEARLPGIEADAEQRVRQNWSNRFRNARSPEQYASLLRQAPAWVSDEAKALVPADKFDRASSPAVLQNWGLTSAQAATAEARQTAQESTDAYRKSTEAFRKARFEWDQSKAAGGGKPMTPGQRKVEERNIYNDEYGTPSRPGGWNGERLRIGATLKSGKKTDSYGQSRDITPEERADLEARYTAATNGVQMLQYRKAELYGLPRPDAVTVEKAKEGEVVDAGDGHTWKKQGGVMWYQGNENAAPASNGGGTAPAPVNNPGNIKDGDGKFRAFANPQEGWDALRADLDAKISGNNKHGLSPKSTILELANVYAPKGDGNNKPEDWANNVAAALKVKSTARIGAFDPDDLAKAVAQAEGSKVPYAPVKAAVADTTPQATTPAPVSASAANPPAYRYTESDVRKRALAAGRNPDAAVQAARQAKLIP